MIYPMYALTVAHANDFAAPDEFVKVAGGLLLLYGIGTMLGPLAAAYGMEMFAPEGLFAFTAAVHLVIIGYVVFRMTRRMTPNSVLRGSFQGLPVAKTATQESASLDPRSGDDMIVAIDPSHPKE
jgi:MFS family permease